ncbi:hypothetical protein CANCADRAFT_30981 [Tortispora caseinolytica NRRL Y-17796]|uniref:Xylanolytic transcriptional activator regulatory domain-containing protein n=1 Tax=Tortispora caseinolytica NRRL Y-17796 TaxID=767744 RepID=A0A1E4TDL1_9ASCO|nr:hypothetical protein CANCADRAFT_30981 [Tortispora caseinolytica NRRL Y-17796]
MPEYTSLLNVLYMNAKKLMLKAEFMHNGHLFFNNYYVAALCFLARIDFQVGRFSFAWNYGGDAIKVSVARDAFRMKPIDFKQASVQEKRDEEFSVRVFWMSYIVERSSCLATTWPTSLDDEKITTRLPFTDKYFENYIPQRVIYLSDIEHLNNLDRIEPDNGITWEIISLSQYKKISEFAEKSLALYMDSKSRYWDEFARLDSLHTKLMRIPSDLFRHETDNFAVYSARTIFQVGLIMLYRDAYLKVRTTSEMNPEQKEAYRIRYLRAAGEAADIFRSMQHVELQKYSPDVAFNLYIVAKVFKAELKQTGIELGEKKFLQANYDFLLSMIRGFPKSYSLIKFLIPDFKNGFARNNQSKSEPAESQTDATIPMPISMPSVDKQPVPSSSLTGKHSGVSSEGYSGHSTTLGVDAAMSLGGSNESALAIQGSAGSEQDSLVPIYSPLDGSASNVTDTSHTVSDGSAAPFSNSSYELQAEFPIWWGPDAQPQPMQVRHPAAGDISSAMPFTVEEMADIISEIMPDTGAWGSSSVQESSLLRQDQLYMIRRGL